MKALKIFYSRNKITCVYVCLSPILLILSIFYALILILIKFLYRINIFRSYRPRLKTISVGNITMGGTGKTPFVEYLAFYLSPRKRRLAVLLRGYKRPKKNSGIGMSDYYLMGDEACFLKENLQGKAYVFSSVDRMAQAKVLDEEGLFDTIVLDDGFQHWRLKRDLDIVVINSLNAFGNGFILPLGPLRECVGSLKRAHIFCLTKVDEVSLKELSVLREKLKSINPDAGLIETIHAPEYFYDPLTKEKITLDEMLGKKLYLMAGLANPASFVNSFKKTGMTVLAESYFDDHHEYNRQDLMKVFDSATLQGADFIVTTEKDVVRFKQWLKEQRPKVRCLVLKINLKIISGEEILDERLHSLYTT